MTGRRAAWCASGLLAAGGALLCAGRFNASASLPRGFYLVIPRGWVGRPPARGDVRWVSVAAPAGSERLQH